MTRTQWTLTVVLAVQVALLLLTTSFSGDTGAGESRPLVPELASITPARIQIADGDDNSVTLERSDRGWTLTDEGGYPATSDRVDNLLEDLEQVEVRRPVVTGSRYHEALKVTDSDFERHVRIWADPAGDPEVDLYVGTSPNYRLSHVRRAEETPVYEARGISTTTLNPDAGAWVDKQILNIEFDRVTALRLRNEHGEFRVERDGESWKLTSPTSDKPLDKPAVDSLVRSLSSLWISDPAGKVSSGDFGLDTPVAEVEIAYRAATPEPPDDESDEAPDDTEASDTAPKPEPVIETVTLKIGAESEEGKRYASKTGFDFAVVLSKYDAEKATAKKLDDLYPDEDS